MAFERFDFGFARVFGGLSALNPLTVAAVANTGLSAAIPNVPPRRSSDGIEIALRYVDIQLLVRAAAITQRPSLLDKVGRIGAHRPLVTIGRHLAVAVKIIQEDELAHQLMVIGRDSLAHETQAGIAVAGGDVAEHLIISPIFFNDVNAMFDRTWIAYFPRDGIVIGGACAGRQVGPKWTASIGLLAVGRHLFRRWQVKNAQSSLKQTANIIPNRRVPR